jgi:subtilisin family serine protease
MEQTPGLPGVIVGVIDGPVDLTHPDLARSRVSVLPVDPSTPEGCRVRSSFACRHGTFVVGMLAASRESEVPGICPGCTILVRQVFCEARPGQTCPLVTPRDLAAAVVDTVNAGARVINLSLGVGAAAAMARDASVDDAFDFAFRRGVLVVAAAGNHALIGPAPLLTHPWLIQVAACDLTGRPLRTSNLGIGIGRSGLLAPGAQINGLAPGGRQRLSGTSAATPFVTGTAALLWSLHPAMTAAQIRAALLRPGLQRRSIVPPLLDAAAIRQ